MLRERKTEKQSVKFWLPCDNWSNSLTGPVANFVCGLKSHGCSVLWKKSCAYLPIQLFRERLCHKRGKASATMPKIIMGNGSFYGCFKMFQRGGRKQRIPSFTFIVAESPWTSIKQNQTLTTHNSNRHCHLRFYKFMGQPLSKQLSTVIWYEKSNRMISERKECSPLSSKTM